MKQVTIHTNHGDMNLTFFPDKAPKHVENFVDLAETGFYDGKTFHRIIDGFMIQGGCPQGNGMGDGPRRLQAEFNDTPHVLGTLSMARGRSPDSATAYFFVCVGDQPSLDFGGARNPDGQGFAAFGQVVEGMDVVRAIQSGETRGQTLLDPVTILSIRRLEGP